MEDLLVEAQKPAPRPQPEPVIEQGVNNVKMLGNNFNFSVALNYIKQGHWVTREGWNGNAMFISIMIPDPEGKNRVSFEHPNHGKATGLFQFPYIFMKTAQNTMVPWVASHTDLLAGDWRLFTSNTGVIING